MNLKSLRMFVTVANQGSVSEAARTLHIAQPALSVIIQNLEEKLSLNLFTRNSRGVTLTEEGEILYQHATQLLNTASNIEREMAELRDLDRGEVRIGIPGMLGSYYFPDVIMAFRNKFPQLRVTMVEAGTRELGNLILSGELDAGVIVSDQPIPSLKSTKFVKFPMMVCCHKNHPFSEKSSISPEEFLAEELVIFNKGYFHRAIVDRLSEQHEMELNIGFETNLVEVIKKLIKSSSAVSTMLKMAIKDDPELICRPFTTQLELTASIAWRPNVPLSKANQAFVDFLIDYSEGRSL